MLSDSFKGFEFCFCSFLARAILLRCPSVVPKESNNKALCHCISAFRLKRHTECEAKSEFIQLKRGEYQVHECGLFYTTLIYRDTSMLFRYIIHFITWLSMNWIGSHMRLRDSSSSFFVLNFSVSVEFIIIQMSKLNIVSCKTK